MMYVEYFEDEAGEYRYRIKGANGEIMVTSEGYTSLTGAHRGFQDLARNMLGRAGYLLGEAHA